MILIADGGSTKCDWALIQGNKVQKTQTLGLNSTVVSQSEIKNRIAANKILMEAAPEISHIEFFGAGCGSARSRLSMSDILGEFFPNAKIEVVEDTVGAVKAVTDQEAIVCILGTGSNSCYFDGKNIEQPIASLGYVIMDEAGASHFGKMLIRDYYYNRMPVEIRGEFEKGFNLNREEILFKLYKEPSPGVYLASFSTFIFKDNLHQLYHPYFKELINNALELFVQNRILTFPQSREVPIHFVGSIAHFSKDSIGEILEKHQLKLGKIVRYPIDELIRKYQKPQVS